MTSIGFTRIQFTPDLMPSDVTGASIYNQRDADFEFRPGPIFTNLLLADEINRAPPKTQAALLEAMQERQVTIEGTTHLLAPPFLVLATQNPIEYEGTYPLPEAQLDRFLLRLGVGYPEREQEWEVLERRLERTVDDIELEPVVGRDELLEMQRAVEQVHVDRSVGMYMVDLVAATRTANGVQVGASPRGSLALLKLSRCRAAIEGRDYVTPDDVKSVAVPALAHRLALRPELWVQRLRPDDIVQRAARPRPDAEGRAGARSRARAGRGVTRAATPKLGAYAALAGTGLLAALVLGRPELAALAAPFAVVLAAGLSLAEPPRVRAWLELDRERQVEGEEVTAQLELAAESAVPGLELLLDLPDGVESLGENPQRRHLDWDERPEIELPAPLLALGRLPGRRAAASRPGPVRAARLRAEARPPAAAEDLPARRRAGKAVAPARDADVRRECRRRAHGARGSSSPTCGPSSRATAFAASTGARPPAAASRG